MENSLISYVREVYNGKRSVDSDTVKKIFSDIMEKRAVLDVSALGYDRYKLISKPEPELRALNLIKEIGIRVIDGVTSTLGVPVMDGNVCQWLSETEAGNLNDLQFSSVILTPHRLFSYVEYDRDIILQSNADIAGGIEIDLLNAMYEAVQEKLFSNAFPSDSSLIESVSDYSDLVTVELKASQHKINNCAYVVSPLAGQKLKLMQNSVFPVMVDGKINGKPVYETASLDGEKIIYGDFSKMIIAQFGVTDLTVDHVSKAKDGIIALVLNSYWDAQVMDPKAFVFADMSEESSGD